MSQDEPNPGKPRPGGANEPPPHQSGPVDVDPREGEERFRTLVEHIPGVATYLDVVIPDDPGHSVPVYISPQIEDILGYPHGAWLTDEELWLQVLHPEDAERMIAADEDARRHREQLSAEYRMTARDGRTVWVSEKSAVVRDVATGRLYWQGVMVDITERKEVEQALQASELKFRTIFDAAAIGVITLGVDGRIQEANVTLEQAGDYGPGELNGKPLADFLEPEDGRSRDVFAEIVAGNRERCDLEHRFLRKDGALVWCRTVMSLVRDAAGGPSYVIGMLEDISDRKRAEEELVRRAVHDPLTGLPNRQLFLDRLGVALAQSERRPGAGVAVIFMDLDRFKEVNDSLGHQAGDELLIGVSLRLSQAVRPADTVARFGGDEFVVLVGDVTSVADAEQLAHRLSRVLTEPFELGDHRVPATASIGVAMTSDATASPESLIRQADAAMYRAKEHGRNRVEVFDGRA
jgi:diguanylate cyclase (GGDEF)-like protein/PAS domain S-box-containing protein